MVDGALFDALEALARGIRGKQEPFGGIQLILAGQMRDFSALCIRTATCCCAVSQQLELIRTCTGLVLSPYYHCLLMCIKSFDAAKAEHSIKFGPTCMSSAMGLSQATVTHHFVDLTSVQLCCLMCLKIVTLVYCAAVQGLCTEHQSSAGDYHQLPPVAKGKEAAAARKFAFEAATWRQCVHHCAQLTKVFRQVSASRSLMLVSL